MIKDIWAKLSYFWFLMMLIIVGLLCGGLDVNASEIVTTNLKKSYIRLCDSDLSGNCSWSSSYDMGTAMPINDNLLDAFRVRFGSNNKFLKGVKYRVKANVDFGGGTGQWNCDATYVKLRDVSCAGSSTSSWSSNADYIESCQFISRECYTADNRVRAHYYFDVVTNTDIYGIQINGYFKNTLLFNTGPVTVMTSSNVQYDRDTTDAINNSTTTIINNNKENTKDIIDSNKENTKEITDTMKDDNVDDPSSSISDFEDLLPNNGVITNLITLPIQFFTRVVNSINGQCIYPLTMPFFNDTILYWRCWTISDYLGNVVTTTLDIIISGLFVYKISRKMVKVFENFTSLKEGDVISND